MTLTEVAHRLEGKFSGRVELAFPLARLTTYRLGGPAELYVEPAGVCDLELLGEELARMRTELGRMPVTIIGRGSNLVVSDLGLEGVVIRLGPRLSWCRPAGSVGIVSGAATPLPQIANWALRRSLTGVEFLVAIPGSLGGGVRMNAGAHGAELSSVLRSAVIFSLGDLAVSERSSAALGLGYRRSNLTDDDLVVEARLELRPDQPSAIGSRMSEWRHHRADTQPGAAQNAGSVFKNPPGDFAGRLVEECGLKGFSVGGASVSALHANFFIAGEGATSQDVYDLVHEVSRRVRERTGVELEPEVRFAGRFRAAADARGPT